MTATTRRGLLAAIIVTALAGWPAGAPASWPAPDDVKEQIAADIDVTAGCMQADQSTVDPDWVVVFSRSSPACHHLDSGLVLHYVDEHWQTVAEMHDPNIGCPFSVHVPADIALDLTLCSPPRTSLLCRINAAYVRYDQPYDCDLRLPRKGAWWFANLRGMKWRGWAAARAHTTARVTTPTGHRVQVAVVAYGRRLGCGKKGHDYVYTRVRITSHAIATKVLRMPSACHVVGHPSR
jgi:hypothetical protein